MGIDDFISVNDEQPLNILAIFVMVLVLTFSISATFVLGDHLGFIAGVDPEMVVPMMVSKMVAGITALLLANVLAPKLLKA